MITDFALETGFMRATLTIRNRTLLTQPILIGVKSLITNFAEVVEGRKTSGTVACYTTSNTTFIVICKYVPLNAFETDHLTTILKHLDTIFIGIDPASVLIQIIRKTINTFAALTVATRGWTVLTQFCAISLIRKTVECIIIKVVVIFTSETMSLV